MNLLLDTQIFLWLDSDQAKLSSAAKSVCSDANNTLWLSAASAWEMQIQTGLGRLIAAFQGLRDSTECST